MSQNNNPIPNQKKGENTMYKLDYKEHNILKQAAFVIMQHKNNIIYNSDKPHNKKKFIKYNQTLAILYKTNTREQLLDIIDRYQRHQEKQNNKKLIQHNQSQVIIPKLENITDKQLERITQSIKQLEQNYYIDIDIDYTNKQSILQAYQQLMYYKHYNIPIQPRETEQPILIGNSEILEKVAIQ